MDEQNQKGLPNQAPSGFPPAASSFGGQQSNRPTPPPPPPPEITLRTMRSDLESLKETGGSAPTPKPFTPQEFKQEMPRPTAPPPPPPKITPSDFGAPRMETQKEMKPSSSTVIEEGAPKISQGGLKKILIWALAAAVAIGIGLISYYYLYPLLFPSSEAPAPMISAPAVTEPEQVPDTNVEVPQAAIPAPIQHQSLLKSSDAEVSAQLESIDATSIAAALQKEAANQLTAGSLTEITLNDANGLIPSSKILSALLPDMPESIKNLFEDDFTAALYYDANGVWPAYISKLKLEANIIEAQTVTKNLEISSGLANLFLSDPGIQNSAGFKDGKVNDLSSRYLTFSKKGAAINLVWINDKFIISASYNGLKKILNNL